MPSARGDHGPDGFNQAERPCALEEAVHGSEHARDREAQDEIRAPLLERVTDHHQRDGTQTEEGQRTNEPCLIRSEPMSRQERNRLGIAFQARCGVSCLSA